MLGAALLSEESGGCNVVRVAAIDFGSETARNESGNEMAVNMNRTTEVGADSSDSGAVRSAMTGDTENEDRATNRMLLNWLRHRGEPTVI